MLDRKRASPLIVPFILIAVIGGGLLLGYLSTMQKRMQDEAMLVNARIYASVLSSTQAFYASEVLPHVDADKIEITHNFKENDNSLPFPATLTINFAKYLSENGTNFSAAMLSDYPFKWRSGRPLSKFDRRALDDVAANNSDEYFEYERGTGEEPDLLNYARTIRMQESCVACHNGHPASAKNDWEVGDARGMHVIALPVNTLASGMTREFTYLIILIAIATTLTAAAIAVVRQREYLAHQKLEVRNGELLAANLEKDRANAAKSEFLANISHEIRTPINGILGLSELMILDNPRADERDRLKRIRSAGTTLLYVINDVLDFSKIEANKITLEVIPFEVEKIAEGAVGLFVYEQKNLDRPKLFVDIDPGLPAEMLGDPHRISQVVTNLLSNAFKFTETGHVLLSIRRDEIEEDKVLFKVTDTGPGIEECAKEALFKPFSQADGTVTRRYGGTGLGLAISFDLAERMGGTLELVSKVGVGSTFTLALPLSPATPEGPTILTERTNGLKLVHILDTEHVRLTIFEKFFRDLGLRCATISSVDDIKFVLERVKNDNTGSGEVVLVNLDGDIPSDVAAFCEANQSPHLIVLYPPDDTSADYDRPTLQRPTLPTALMRYIYEQLGSEVKASDKPLEAQAVDTEVEMPLKDLAVLAVDDNHINRVVIKAFLDRAGATTSLANSGEEAIEAMSKNAFDVILMDIQMPDMDGYEAAHAIWDAGHDVPIIALTAHALMQDIERSTKEGMTGHLSKPVSREALYTILAPFKPVV